MTRILSIVSGVSLALFATVLAVTISGCAFGGFELTGGSGQRDYRLASNWNSFEFEQSDGWPADQQLNRREEIALRGWSGGIWHGPSGFGLDTTRLRWTAASPAGPYTVKHLRIHVHSISPLALFLALPAAQALMYFGRWGRRSGRVLRGLCPACGYDLRATPDRCPECNLQYDADDPVGIAARWPIRWFVHRPIGWPTIAAASGCCLLALWKARLPTPYYMLGELGLLLPLWLAGFALWVVRVGLPGAIAAAQRRPHSRLNPRQQFAVLFDLFVIPRREVPDRPRADVRRWRWLGVMLAATTLLVILKVPLRIGFHFAREGLDALVAEIGDAATPALGSDRRVGPYMVDRRLVTRAEHALVFRLRKDGESAFIYSPEKEPHGYYNAGNHGHLSGPWYWCKED